MEYSLNSVMGSLVGEIGGKAGEEKILRDNTRLNDPLPSIGQLRLLRTVGLTWMGTHNDRHLPSKASVG